MYALIQNGLVSELYTPPSGFTLAQCFTPDVAVLFAEVPDGATVAPGYIYATGTFAPQPVASPTVLTLAEQADALLGTGLAITSTGTHARDGQYAADPQTISFVNSEMIALASSKAFADGTTSIEWPDADGALHEFNTTEFAALATALGAFVSGVRKCIIGASGAVLPQATAVIP